MLICATCAVPHAANTVKCPSKYGDCAFAWCRGCSHRHWIQNGTGRGPCGGPGTGACACPAHIDPP